jgi:hypothetical protein
MRLALTSLAAALLLALPAAATAQGQIIIVNVNAAGVGFNDPTPATPVGGNNGATRGEQRLNVFQRAADIWEATLKPRADVFVTASFVPLGANVLGSAGATFVFSNFPGAELPDTWYPSALADHLAGFDLNPGFADINTRFSSDFNFYLGFDNNENGAAGEFDLLAVVLHELGHGLGFANFVNESTGTLLAGVKDVYSAYTLDVTTNKIWNDMTDAERATSALNVRKVSWDGINVNKDVPHVLVPGEPFANIAPGPGFVAVGSAAFGPPLGAPVSGQVVLAVDSGGASTSDACEPIVNDLAGKVALVDRGTCTFVVKVKNAQNAGAIAVLVADNAAGDPPAGLGGADPTIVIPSVRISLTAGNATKAALAGGPVSATLGVDNSILAGTDRVQGLMMVAAFNPVVSGSSISHWEAVAFPNQLMEPAINFDLTSSLKPPLDLTSSLMTDIGWFSDGDGVPDGVDACIGSNTTPTVVIGTCNSGVPNRVLADGCTFSDRIAACYAGAGNHGGAVSCVSNFTNALKASGLISGSQKGAIQSCAAKTK